MLEFSDVAVAHAIQLAVAPRKAYRFRHNSLYDDSVARMHGHCGSIRERLLRIRHFGVGGPTIYRGDVGLFPRAGLVSAGDLRGNSQPSHWILLTRIGVLPI